MTEPVLSLRDPKASSSSSDTSNPSGPLALAPVIPNEERSLFSRVDSFPSDRPWGSTAFVGGGGS